SDRVRIAFQNDTGIIAGEVTFALLVGEVAQEAARVDTHEAVGFCRRWQFDPLPSNQFMPFVRLLRAMDPLIELLRGHPLRGRCRGHCCSQVFRLDLAPSARTLPCDARREPEPSEKCWPSPARRGIVFKRALRRLPACGLPSGYTHARSLPALLTPQVPCFCRRPDAVRRRPRQPQW